MHLIIYVSKQLHHSVIFLSMHPGSQAHAHTEHPHHVCMFPQPLPSSRLYPAFPSPLPCTRPSPCTLDRAGPLYHEGTRVPVSRSDRHDLPDQARDVDLPAHQQDHISHSLDRKRSGASVQASRSAQLETRSQGPRGTTGVLLLAVFPLPNGPK